MGACCCAGLGLSSCPLSTRCSLVCHHTAVGGPPEGLLAHQGHHLCGSPAGSAHRFLSVGSVLAPRGLAHARCSPSIHAHWHRSFPAPAAPVLSDLLPPGSEGFLATCALRLLRAGSVLLSLRGSFPCSGSPLCCSPSSGVPMRILLFCSRASNFFIHPLWRDEQARGKQTSYYRAGTLPRRASIYISTNASLLHATHVFSKPSTRRPSG